MFWSRDLRTCGSGAKNFESKGLQVADKEEKALGKRNSHSKWSRDKGGEMSNSAYSTFCKSSCGAGFQYSALVCMQMLHESWQWYVIHVP